MTRILAIKKPKEMATLVKLNIVALYAKNRWILRRFHPERKRVVPVDLNPLVRLLLSYSYFKMISNRPQFHRNISL